MIIFGRREALFAIFDKNVKSIGPLRPPYISGDFKLCSQCEKRCDTSCPNGVIKISHDGSPFLDFSVDGCSFCGECAKSCSLGVLNIESKEEKIGSGIELSVSSCLSWSKTNCYSCKDACEYGAISFLGLFFMQLDISRCTRCGYCIKRCPVDAIVIKA